MMITGTSVAALVSVTHTECADGENQVHMGDGNLPLKG